MSSNPPLKIAVAEPWCKPGDVDANMQAIQAMSRDAAAQGADAIVFSESAITGYDFGGHCLRVAMPADAEPLQQLKALSKELGLVIVAGFHEKVDAGIHNSALIALPTGEGIVQRKHMLSDKERGLIISGQRERLMFKIGHANAVVLICADSGIPGIYDDVARQGSQITICITAGCGSVDKAFYLADMTDDEKREAYLKAQHTVCFPEGAVRNAFKHGYAFVGCNQMGHDAEKGYFHPGHSFVADANGEIAALQPGCFMVEHLRPRMAIGQVHV